MGIFVPEQQISKNVNLSDILFTLHYQYVFSITEVQNVLSTWFLYSWKMGTRYSFIYRLQIPVLKAYLDMYKNCQAFWLHGVEQPRPHKCPATPASCKLSHALLWITCQHRLQRVSVDGILDFLSFRIKISFCLPVWDAPCWPTCWVWCEMCVPLLWPYYPLATRTRAHAKLAALTVLVCSFLPVAPFPRLSSHLCFQSLFASSVLRPLLLNYLSAFIQHHLSRHTSFTVNFKENVLFLLLAKQK